jgi:hypothetical protein
MIRDERIKDATVHDFSAMSLNPDDCSTPDAASGARRIIIAPIYGPRGVGKYWDMQRETVHDT